MTISKEIFKVLFHIVDWILDKVKLLSFSGGFVSHTLSRARCIKRFGSWSREHIK